MMTIDEVRDVIESGEALESESPGRPWLPTKVLTSLKDRAEPSLFGSLVWVEITWPDGEVVEDAINLDKLRKVLDG